MRGFIFKLISSYHRKPLPCFTMLLWAFVLIPRLEVAAHEAVIIDSRFANVGSQSKMKSMQKPPAHKFEKHHFINVHVRSRFHIRCKTCCANFVLVKTSGEVMCALRWLSELLKLAMINFISREDVCVFLLDFQNSVQSLGGSGSWPRLTNWYRFSILYTQDVTLVYSNKQPYSPVIPMRTSCL